MQVSVWSKFDNTTSEYQQLLKQDELIPDTDWLDPYNPAGRSTFYNFSNVREHQNTAKALGSLVAQPVTPSPPPKGHHV